MDPDPFAEPDEPLPFAAPDVEAPELFEEALKVFMICAMRFARKTGERMKSQLAAAAAEDPKLYHLLTAGQPITASYCVDGTRHTYLLPPPLQ